jgi:mitochondrial GTPase 1
MEVQRSLCSTFLDFTGNTYEESELESLIDMQLTALRKVFRIPHKPLDETHGPVSKKLLTFFRSGKLGPFILDDLPEEQ